MASLEKIARRSLGLALLATALAPAAKAQAGNGISAKAFNIAPDIASQITVDNVNHCFNLAVENFKVHGRDRFQVGEGHAELSKTIACSIDVNGKATFSVTSPKDPDASLGSVTLTAGGRTGRGNVTLDEVMPPGYQGDGSGYTRPTDIGAYSPDAKPVSDAMKANAGRIKLSPLPRQF